MAVNSAEVPELEIFENVCIPVFIVVAAGWRGENCRNIDSCLYVVGSPVDFVHGICISGMKTMMERQMEIYLNGSREEKNFLTWEETVPGEEHEGFE